MFFKNLLFALSLMVRTRSSLARDLEIMPFVCSWDKGPKSGCIRSFGPIIGHTEIVTSDLGFSNVNGSVEIETMSLVRTLPFLFYIHA